MEGEIEDFDVVCREDGIEGVDAKISIFGKPLHESKEGILERYVDESKAAFFRTEQRRSCGNYLLIDARDPGSIEIVTSPGYASGYVYDGPASVRISTLLTNAVESWGQGDDPAIDGEYLRHFLTKQRPFQGTAFQNVSQLRPACSYRIESGAVSEVSSYIKRPERSSSPSFVEGMRESAAALSDNDVTVMFSGGLDSLSWYLILRSELGDEQVDLTTVDWRPGSEAQGPYLAEPVAEKLGIDLDVVSFDDGWLTDDRAVVDHVTDWMKRDITIGRNPNHALVSFDGTNEVVVNLTNNESLITLQMNHYYRKKYLNSRNTLIENANMIGFLLFHQYVANLPYTAKYMRSTGLRSVYFTLFWPFAKAIQFLHPRGPQMDLSEASLDDIDLSQSAILPAIVGKTAPNIAPGDHPELVGNETDEIAGLVDCTDLHHLARIAYYYAHMTWTANTLQKLPLSGQGARTYLPTNWGPMLSSSLFEDLTLKDTIFPRRQLLDVVKQETGYSFEELRPLSEELGGDSDRVSTGTYREDVYSSVIREHGSLLMKTDSALKRAMGGQTRDWYDRQLEDYADVVDDGRGDFGSVLRASRMVNLELLVQNST